MAALSSGSPIYRSLGTQPGRLGVVLPESFFSTKENLRARLFLFDHFNVKAVVGLPRDAFQPWTPTRTSLLFAQKKTKDEEVAWKDVRRSKQDAAVRTIKRAQKELRALRKIKNVATLAQRGQRGAQIVEAVQNAVSMFDLDGALKTSNVADIHSAVDSFLDAIESFNVTQWAFRQSAIAHNSKFYVLNVSNIGYKRTKRAEYKRPNDLFTAYEVSSDDHTLTDDRILNLNSSVNDWRVIPKGSGAKDAMSLLSATLQWDQ